MWCHIAKFTDNLLDAVGVGVGGGVGSVGVRAGNRSRHLIVFPFHQFCKQISAILDEKGRLLTVFFDFVDVAIKIHSNEHASQFSWSNGIFVVPQGLRI